VRLVLIDGESDRICGDTASFAARFREWADVSAKTGDVESLAKTAARLLDESNGRTYRTYNFAAFAPKGGSSGYFVFRCEDGPEFAPAPLDQSKPEAALGPVMMGCFYVGYVLCDLLVI
jgi:hypothetical protein